MRFFLLGLVIWCLQDVSGVFFKAHRIARQIRFPRSPSPDNVCSTPGRRAGKCIVLPQCRHLVEQKNYGMLRQSMCGFEGKTPKVCCPALDEDEATASASFKGHAREITLQTTLKQSLSSGLVPTQPPRLYSNESRLDGKRGRKSPFPAECGRSQVAFRRIVGGQESVIGAWPWMAVIYYLRRIGKSAECGGALVTNKHVITAAHCIVTTRRGTTMSPRQLKVRLGDYDLESDDDGASPIEVSVQSVIKYPDFNARTFQNDIAVLVLSSEVEFDKHIIPLCIPFDVFHGDSLANRNAYTAGWGTTSYGGPASPKLREVQLRIWENPQCKEVFRRDVPITATNLCAGDGDKDACRGDSGGPLMLASGDGRFYLIGIVSFGKKCAEPGFPGVYTRTSFYLDWIEQTVENTM